MTDYEIATLALRVDAVRVAIAQVAATVLIGLGQIGIVWHGIRSMQRAAEIRAREQDQRHIEAMAALQAVEAGAREQAREHEKRHIETMTALQAVEAGARERAREQDQRHIEAMAALLALIERTAQPAGGHDKLAGQ